MVLGMVLLLGCGGAPPRGAVEAEAPTPSPSRERADLVCTEVLPSGEAECVAGGCEWRAPLFCSGIEVPPEVIEGFQRDVSRPCRCVCQRDVLECMARP